MNYRVILSSDLARCRLNILSASHWIPEHRLEECDPEAKKLFEEKQAELDAALKTDIADLKRTRDRALEDYLRDIRAKKGA